MMLRERGRRRTAAPPLVAIALLLGLGCGSGKPPEAIKIPAVSSLRAASDILVERVEVDDNPPDWLDRDREVEGFVYGIGIQAGGRNPSEDLYRAMHNARRTIVVWLESRDGLAAPDASLVQPVRLDPAHIDYERLAHDRETNRWYALARLDIAEATAALESSIHELDQALKADLASLADGSKADDGERVRAALSVLYGIDERRQYEALYHAVTGKDLVPPAGLDDATLRNAADGWLAQHGVRVIVEGADIPGLYEAVNGAMGEVHLRNDEFGRGLVAIRVIESDGFGRTSPYLEIDGTVEMAIEGGDARTRTAAFHVVSTGGSLDEARFRAARDINLEVARIVRDTLRSIGAPDR